MPRLGSGTLQGVLLVSGILSSLVYVAANVVAGLRWEGYSFASQAISELSAIGAPSRFVWLALGIPYDGGGSMAVHQDVNASPRRTDRPPTEMPVIDVLTLACEWIGHGREGVT